MKTRWFRFAAILTTLLIKSVLPAAAQVDKLVVGWTPLEPYFHLKKDGEPGGFSAELARKIAKEAQLDIEFRYFSNISELKRAQMEGRSQLQIGMPSFPALASNHSYSAVVATSKTRLFVLADQLNEERFEKPNNLTIGMLKNIEIDSVSELFISNRIETIDTVETMIFRLLTGSVDGILATETDVYWKSRQAKLDHRLITVGPQVNTLDRVIMLHNSRDEYIEPLDAAITQLESNGELEALRQRYFISMPLSEPDNLLVGVLDFPPYHQMQSDGSATGFAIEVLEAVAELASLELQFTEISIDEWGLGPHSGTYDMLPQVSYTAERAERMDFALPIERASFSIFTRAGESTDITGIDDLSGYRVGVQAVSLVRRLVEESDGLELVIIDEIDALLEALLGKQVDAVLYLTNPILALVEQRGVSEQIDVVTPPFFTSERSPTLRLGLGRVRHEMDAAISLYLLSDDYHALRTKWFDVQPFWTKNRVELAMGITLLTVLVLVGYLIWLQLQRQQEHYRNRVMQSYAEKQSQLIRELEQSNDQLDRFAHIASHDLKEPLRGITINAGYLKRENLNETSIKRVDRMVSLCHRLEQLVSDLLSYSCLGRSESASEVVDLYQLVAGIQNSLAELLDERNGCIVVETALPSVLADKAQIRTVFQNLILNGLRYNNSDRREIQIGYKFDVDAEGDVPCNSFYVRDNGIGIAEKDHDRVFAIFSRLNTEKAYGPGTGAGLSFVQKIVNEYSGDVSFNSEVGVGSIFYFTLPLADTPTLPVNNPVAIPS